MSAKSTMERLQLDIAARLNASAYCADVTIVANRSEETDALVESATAGMKKKAGKTGAAIIVEMPRLGEVNQSAGLLITSIIVPVAAEELPQINHSSVGTGKAVEELVVEIGRRLAGWQPGYTAPLQWDGGSTPSLDFLPRIRHEITLRVPWMIDLATKCAAPDIVVATGTATITNNEAGSAVYFTTDESLPTSTNGTLYTAPFAAGAGTIIRAAAYLAGKEGSDAALTTA